MGLIVRDNLKVGLKTNPSEFHVKVDWSSKGFEYLLFAGHQSKGNMVGVNNKRPKKCSDEFIHE